MKLAETKDVTITTVVDNYTDVLLESIPGVERRGPKKDPLLAEHGLSVHIRLEAEDREILLDVGYTKVVLPHNLSRLGIDPTMVDQIVITHGHLDHTAALADLLQMAVKRVPALVHCDAFLERWFIFSDGSKMGPWHENAQEWEEAGAEIVYVEKPYELAPGCLATGPIPRRTDFEEGMPAAHYRKGEDLVHDPINDDQAIVINVEGKGLIVIAGCAHSGIVNTVLYAQEISDVEEIWAIIGDFHLGSATPEKMERTIAELKAIGPRFVMPAHCTGFVATHRFATEMPDEFVLNAVGTRLTF
jgi:7,8-dihydropterin-6-yl-methyl-4-(beta-D-ribofuranosyl)aminobenzene 5'-phosphate synthase